MRCEDEEEEMEEERTCEGEYEEKSGRTGSVRGENAKGGN